MTVVRLLSGDASAAEVAEEGRSLRPRRLEEYVGQEAAREKLAVALEAARRRRRPLDHVLLYGPPGLGKTTLAHIIARELGSRLVVTSGPAVERAADLMGILTNLEAGDVLFIDEVHRLARGVGEYLYPALEEFAIDFVVDRGPYARTLRLDLKPFTLVAATTRAGLVAPPLRDRFGLLLHLDFYDVEALETIVTRTARVLGVDLDPAGARLIAARSRGTPRVANRLLRRVRDYAEVRGEGRITAAVAEEALRLEGIDSAGLDELDRRLLRTLIDVFGGGPAGVEALAASLNEEVDTLSEVVEPYLLKAGFIVRTPAGRRATARARRHLGDGGERL